MDGQLANRFIAEVRRVLHAVAHPSHRITAVFTDRGHMLGLFCSCGRVFFDRVLEPMTLDGVRGKIARQQKGRVV